MSTKIGELCSEVALSWRLARKRILCQGSLPHCKTAGTGRTALTDSSIPVYPTGYRDGLRGVKLSSECIACLHVSYKDTCIHIKCLFISYTCRLVWGPDPGALVLASLPAYSPTSACRYGT